MTFHAELLNGGLAGHRHESPASFPEYWLPAPEAADFCQYPTHGSRYSLGVTFN